MYDIEYRLQRSNISVQRLMCELVAGVQRLRELRQDEADLPYDDLQKPLGRPKLTIEPDLRRLHPASRMELRRKDCNIRHTYHSRATTKTTFKSFDIQTHHREAKYRSQHLNGDYKEGGDRRGLSHVDLCLSQSDTVVLDSLLCRSSVVILSLVLASWLVTTSPVMRAKELAKGKEEVRYVSWVQHSPLTKLFGMKLTLILVISVSYEEIPFFSARNLAMSAST